MTQDAAIDIMTNGDPFPRVSSRAGTTTRPVSYPRKAPVAQKKHSGPGALVKLRQALDNMPRFQHLSDRLSVPRMPAIAQQNPVATIGGGIGLVMAIAITAILSTGMRDHADATTIGANGLAIMLPAGTIRVVVGQDGSLREALEHASISPGDVDRVVLETSRYIKNARLPSGTAVDIALTPQTQTAAYRDVQSMTLRPRLDTAVMFGRRDGQLEATPMRMAIDATPLRISGPFGGDVRGTLAQYGIGQHAADEYVRIIGAQMAIADIARGDRFDVIVEQARASDGRVNTGDLMYAGLYQGDGNTLRMSQWTQKGRLAWYDATKAARSIDNVQRPVPGEVSSSFGMRFHPILGYSRMHKGIDFRAGVGTPILAVQSGWIEHAGWAGTYGNQVKLQHGGNIETSYSHMSRVAVSSGGFVHQGDVIGYVGATGLATGPHLHFEVFKDHAQINPSLVAFTVGPQLRGADLAGYQRRLDALLGVPVTRAAPLQKG